MKILHIGKYYSPFVGGIESTVRSIVTSKIFDSDVKVVLVHDHTGDKLSSYGDVIGKKTFLYRIPSLMRMLYAPISFRYLSWLNDILKIYQPNIIHIHVPNPYILLLLLSQRARRIPWVLHWHGDIVGTREDLLLNLAYLLFKPIEKRAIKLAKRVIVTSPVYRDSSRPLRPFISKVEVVPLGHTPYVPFSKSGSASAIETNHQANKFRVLFVGRFTPFKGLSYLIRTAAMLPNIDFHIIGAGHCEKDMQQLINTLGLSNTLLRGEITGDALNHEYDACDCLCLPSITRAESFGMVLLEAMAHGKPCIVTSVAGSGMSWVVQNERTGLVVPPHNSSALAAAIYRLSLDPSLVIRFGEAGRERFLREFTEDRMAERIRRLYLSVMNTL